MGYNKFKKNDQVRNIINRYKTIRDKIIRVKSSITFLIRCKNAGIIPNFITNSTKNLLNIFNDKHLHSIQHTILKYTQDLHHKVLNLTIQEKHQLLRQLKGKIEILIYNLEGHFSVAEIEEFLSYEDKVTESFDRKIKEVHRKKFDCLYDLQKKKLGIKLNSRWFVNKSGKEIPTDVQWVLSLGQKHALPVEKKDFPVLKIIADGEDFVQTIQNKEEQEIARTKLTTIIDSHINKIRLTDRDRFILNKVKETKGFLKENKDIVILNADKGNTTVAMNRCDYDSRIDDIIEDTTKYVILNRDPTNKLQSVNNSIVEELLKKGIITATDRNRLKTNISTAPRLYGVPKVHKKDFPLRPICSYVNSPSYELCKYVTNILRKVTEQSEYNIKNSLQFRDRIKGVEINNSEKFISFDVISLFPSIPVDLAIDIIKEKWDKIKEHTDIDEIFFLRILKFCIVDNRYFQYRNKIYAQRSGLPMGSPASPIVADIVMEELLDSCIAKLSIRPKIVLKYVDDLFCIVEEDAVDNMLSTFNNYHPSIKFTIERESDSKLPYLETLIIRRHNKIVMDWYQKPTSSGRILNYYSKHPRRMIINTAKNMIARILTISDKEFHNRNKEIIKNILIDNSFPIGMILRLIRQHGSQRKYNSDITGEPVIYKSLTYVPELSERLEKSKIFDNERYKMAHRTYNTINRLFSNTKDRIDKFDVSNIVYKIPCGGNQIENCNKVYVGTTKNKLKTRIAGHKSDQKYRDISTQKTALSAHCSKSNHCPNFKEASILNKEFNYKRRYMLEMLQIINIPTLRRINFKTDTDKVAQNYRYLVNKK